MKQELRKVRCLTCGTIKRTKSETCVTCSKCKIQGTLKKYFEDVIQNDNSGSNNKKN